MQLPKDLLIVRIERVKGAVPSAPKQSDGKRARCSIKREQALRLGIPLDTILSRLGTLGDLSEPGHFARFGQTTVKTSGGNEVLLNDVVEVQLVTVKRPLVVRKASTQHDPTPK